MAQRTPALLSAAALLLAAITAQADTYPVSGRWGVSASTEKGPIDCGRLRVITFNGNQRTDTGSGVPAYRNRSVRPDGAGFRVVDEFTTGQINNGHTTYTLKITDADHAEINMQPGGLVKLRKCR